MHGLEIDWNVLKNAKIYIDIYIKYGVFFEAYTFTSNFVEKNKNSPKEFEELFQYFLEKSCEYNKVNYI
jgi:hypothetical protein